jgi:hypothetical protein
LLRRTPLRFVILFGSAGNLQKFSLTAILNTLPCHPGEGWIFELYMIDRWQKKDWLQR